MNQTTLLGHRLVDACLENRLAKLITEPMLTITEKSLDFFLPESKSTGSDKKTLTRIVDLNNRVYNKLYESTLQKMALFHTKFAYNIHRLKSVSEVIALASREKLGQTLRAVSSNSLFSQCVKLVQTNKIPFSVSPPIF